MTSDILIRSSRNPLAWGVFLATSWTWCIGMFLPVLLIHNFGFAGWLVFALPNIVGAAAMGWVLRDPEQSRRMVQKHRAACVTFSLVTVLFHLYFLAWVVVRIANPLFAIIAVPLAGLLWMLASTDRRAVRMAITIYVFSLLAFALAIALLGTPTWSQEQTRIALGQRGVAWLLPVCCLGFFTCPYLDLTFHRARQETSRDGAKVAFGVGFSLFFLMMIVFTLWYAGRIDQQVFSGGTRDLLIWLVAAHMVVQSAFTMAAHAQAVCPAESVHPTKIFTYAGYALLCFALFFVLLLFSPYWGVDGYLCFMAFYALIAPAYICCHVAARRPAGIFFLIPFLLGIPFYWLGFFQNWTIWLLPGVAIVLVAAMIARYSGSSAASASSESAPARQESTL